MSDPYRYENHMSIPIMLAFDARSLLTADGVRCSDGKLVEDVTTPSFDEGYFRRIPFEHVYHDSPTRDRRCSDARMSEVVYPGRLPLIPHLSYVVCRTAYDRLTLLIFLETKPKGLGPGLCPSRHHTRLFSIRRCTYNLWYSKKTVLHQLGFKMSTWNLAGHD